MSNPMSTYRAIGVHDGKESPRLTSGGTQRSNTSLRKVEPWFSNEALELISNPGSGKGSRNLTPTPPMETKVKAFQPAMNSLIYFANKSFTANELENVNVLDREGLSALHQAVRANDVLAVGSLLENGADINLADRSGLTPLLTAARFNRVEMVKLLLERRADPFIENDSFSMTALHEAARRGFREICILLLNDSRIKATTVNYGKVSPLHTACMGGDRGTCELILSYGADITYRSAVTNNTPLHFAAWTGDEEICDLLIKEASKTLSSVSEYINRTNREGGTALHIACMRGHVNVVDLLLRHGADRDALNWVACTSPLHYAAKSSHVELVELLILYGAVIDGRDGNLRTPLHSAAAFNHGRIVELLLENGADVEAKDQLAMTPLMMAVTHGAPHSLKVLLENGAEITTVDASLNSCLHLAVTCRKPEMVKLLLERDRDKLVLFKDKDLKTVFHLAAGLEDSKILEILLQEIQELETFLNHRDASEQLPLHNAAENGSLSCLKVLCRCPFLLNERDSGGRTALHVAANNKHAKACEFLIQKGADVTSTDTSNRTPLHLAVKAGSLKTVKILRNYLLPCTLERKDDDGNTPLHVACMYNRLDILKFLLDEGANVTAINSRNMTCLEVAIEWEAKDVAMTLMRHERWEEVLQYSPGVGVYPMRKLIEKLPDVAEVVLDKCITYSPLPPSHEDFSVTFNFVHLDPETNAEFHNFFAPACMAKHRREKLLNHNVTQALLRWKWLILGKFATLINGVVMAAFVILLSCLVVIERNKINFSFTSSEKASSGDVESKSAFEKAAPSVILAFLVIQLIKEVIQMVWQRLSYFKDYTNLLELAMYALVCTFILPHIIGTTIYSMETQWIAGILGLLLSYINLTLSLRRFGGLGLYITMYVEVLHTFLKVMSTFMIALTGYSLVFFALLKEQGNFSTFWLALAKAHVTMVGELDYSETLVENTVNNQTVPGTNIPYVPMPILTFFLFLMFILLFSVVLVNLLVGLAVGDIESIQRTATLRALIDQALLVENIMKSYPSFTLRKIYRSSLEIKPNQASFIKRVALAGTDTTGSDFMDIMLNRTSGANTSDEWYQQVQLREERQEESIQKLQATVEAQGRLLEAMADRLRVMNYE